MSSSLHHLFLSRLEQRSFIYRHSIASFCNKHNNDLIPAETRRFSNLYIDFSSIELDIDKLDYSIDYWKRNGIRNLWAYVESNQSHIIPSLIERDFDFSYCGKGYLLLSKWMHQNDEDNKLPHTPSSIVGVAGICHNEKNEILLVQEKNHVAGRKWKFPGGLADFGEDIDDAIMREVYEETGIRSTFKSVLGFRHQHGVKFGGSSEKCKVSDFYIVCRLVVSEKDGMQQINKCKSEIYDAKWISLSEFLFDIDSWPINKEFAQILYDNLAVYKEENELNEIDDLRRVKLPCDLSYTMLDSVAVPNSKYKLFRTSK